MSTSIVKVTPLGDDYIEERIIPESNSYSNDFSGQNNNNHTKTVDTLEDRDDNNNVNNNLCISSLPASKENDEIKESLSKSSSILKIKNKSNSKTMMVGSPSSSQRSLDTRNRQKSSQSLFSLNRDTDVFEIDQHVEKLSNSLKKKHRESHSQTNAWSTKRNFTARLLLGSCFRAPRVFSADELCRYAQMGDLVLYRQGHSFEDKYLSPEILRGIKSTLDGRYMTKHCQIKMWNNVGIVVSLFEQAHSDGRFDRNNANESTTGEYVKYVLYADDIGIKLRKLSELFYSCVLSHELCALRPLNLGKDKRKNSVHASSSFIDNLETIALLAKRGKLLWSSLEDVLTLSGTNNEKKDISANNNDNNKTPDSIVDEDTVELMGNPLVCSFSRLFVHRMKKFSFSPSEEGVREARRLFHSLAAVYEDTVELENSSSIGESGVRQLSKILSRDDVTLPIDFIFKSVGVMNGIGDEDSKGGESDVFDRLKRMIEDMDDDKNGKITANEFIEAFVSVPCHNIPKEFDLPSVCQGETLACLLVALEIIKEDFMKNEKLFFHPQSFSSISLGEEINLKLELRNSKVCTPVVKVTKDMLCSPKVTKFRKDILLRLH